MGFYGNITNTARTSFQFDKIYSSRYIMDQSANSDGVYAGRYVLVNYEDSSGNDYYVPGYKTTDGTNFYFGSSINGELLTRFKWVSTMAEATDADVVYNGQIIAIPPDHIHNVADPLATNWEFWQATNYETINEVNYATFVQYSDIYSVNYNIDVDYYHTSRGYDSTVWQKTYQDNVDKYVMVAELNTVVPTFDIAADAPRMIPLTPHFGADSSNVYYKLHWSPSWGFRVKAVDPNLQIPVLDNTGAGSRKNGGALTKASTDTTTILYDQEKDKFLSDETTNWYKTVYTVDDVNGEQTIDYVLTVDNNNGDWIPVNEDLRDRPVNNLPQAVIEPQAAIYYNKAGFDPRKISYGYVKRIIDETTYKPGKYYKKENGIYSLIIDTTFNSEIEYYEKINDHILLEPTGRSGHVYEAHDGTIIDTVQTDTQELSIMLPALGNTIASIWDLIYGNEAINNSTTRNLDITWESARESLDRHGLRLVTDYNYDDTTYLYHKDGVETIAGALNSVHDLLGMVIISDTDENLNENINSLDEKRIYYNNDLHTFNRKHKGYTYTTVDNNIYNYVAQSDITENDYEPGKYYYLSDDSYIIDDSSTITSDRTYYLRSLNVDSIYSEVNDLVQFDGLTYAYQDYLGEDDESSINKKDYVRDPKFYKDKKYYRWDQITATQYPNLADTYEANKYYRLDGFNYIKAMEDTPYANSKYFSYIEENRVSIQSQGYDGIYLPGKYLYKEGDTYRVDTSVYMTSGRAYYMIESSQATIDGAIYTRNITYVQANLGTNGQFYSPGVYYYEDSNNPGEYILATGAYDSSITYFIKNETLTLVNSSDYYSVSGDAVNLIQFHEGEFFTLDGDNYIAITNLSNVISLNSEEIYVLRKRSSAGESGRDGTYRLNDDDYHNNEISAMIIQDQYYEPNQFHYLTTDINGYTSYILDKYPTKTHGTNYYTLSISGNPVDLNFYDSYTYYQLNETTGEYTLITSDTKPNSTIYQQNTYYVINDSANIYPKGAIWNFDAKYVPSTLTLGTRTEHWELQPITEFGRTINTMHGMLLKMRSILEYGDEDTRDLRTVQGALNTLADKIAQLSTLKPGEILVVDDYGRLHSAVAESTDWTNIEVDPSTGTPKVKVNHKFNPEISTTTSLDLKTATSADTNFTTVTTIPDEMGHQVATNTETIYLPHGYGIVSADSGEALAAGSTYATINFAGANDWISTTATTVDNIKTIQITHNDPVSTGAAAYGDTDNQSPAFGSTFKVPSFSVDSKGHVVTSSEHTVAIPSLSLNASTSSGDGTSVLQSITLASGTFTTTSVDPANLKLTGFDLASVGDDVTAITANHTVGQAFKILDSKIGTSVTNAISNLSWNDIKDISFTYTPTISAEVTEFWEAYDQYVADLNPNEDGYYIVEVTEEDYQVNTYYILNESTYELSSDPYDATQTYYLSFNDFLENLFNEHTGWSDIYAAGRPETPVPQTYTLESFVNQVAAHLAATE